MKGRPLRLALLAAAACACVQAPPPVPSPLPTPEPTVLLAPPAAAVLTEAAGLPLVARSDRLTAAEYAASSRDPLVDLDAVAGWGWAAASSREFAAGGRRVSVVVVLSDRPAGAERAFGAWAAAAATAPLAAGTCPDAIAGLDACRLGQAGPRTVVVGRLGAATFRLEAEGVDATPLAAAQAARLRAGP